MEMCKRVLMFEEGFAAVAYLCPAGFSTIGYGHNLEANPLTENDYEALGLSNALPLRMTKGQAEALLVRDIDRLVVPAAHRIFGADRWQSMGEIRRAALGSMIYQLGESGLRGFHDLLSCVRRSDWNGAADAALLSKWARQTTARARRHAIAMRANKDVWRLVR